MMQPPNKAVELQLDGLVGPTHHYAGLAYGNVASMTHRGAPSNPRAAALEGLAKMERVMALGVPQAVLPPQERPHLPTLRALGFRGSAAEVLERCYRDAPDLLAAVSSASSMWAANAATVTPSADAADGRVHFTPANLVTHFHRFLEAEGTHRALLRIFPDPERFAVHPPLPPSPALADEGAANHMRLAPAHGSAGIEVFVYGRRALRVEGREPARFPARQALEASESVARRHRTPPERTVFLRQNPKAIDAGVFHNDVAAVSNEDVLLCHASAWADPGTSRKLARRFQQAFRRPLHLYRISERRLPLRSAVATYLFNSQILTLPDGGMAIVAPTECRADPEARGILAELVETEGPIRAVHYVHVRQSMRNGGGPACLRLRVVLTPEEFRAVHRGVLLTPDLLGALRDWVNRHYRDRLVFDDLRDPQLLQEVYTALEELAQLLDLGPGFYPSL